MSQQAVPLADTTAVDSDVHIYSPPPEVVGEYLDEPYRSGMINPPAPIPSDSWDLYRGGRIDFERIKIRDPATIQEDHCEPTGVDYPIINMHTKITRLPKSDLAATLMCAYNDILLAEFLDAYDHFHGLASLATQKPDEAAEELDRMGSEGSIVGAYIVNTGPQNPPLGDPRYDPMYRAAEDNGLPVVFHSSKGGAPYEFPRQNQAVESEFEVHAISHPWSHMLTLTSLIAIGVPEKFPELEFVFLEAGVSWVPYMAYRLNKEYRMRRDEVPLLERSPEAYIRESFYFGSQPIGEPDDPADMRDLLRIVGADSILFTTDYPHWDFDHPEALDDHLRANFTPEERERVLSGNANEVFGLGL